LKIFEFLGDTWDKFFAGTFGLPAVPSASSKLVLPDAIRQRRGVEFLVFGVEC